MSNKACLASKYAYIIVLHTFFWFYGIILMIPEKTQERFVIVVVERCLLVVNDEQDGKS